MVVCQIVRHPLIWSERLAWKFMHPTSQPAPIHSIRSWHSLVHGCLPSMGQMYQPHPSQAYSQREWQQDNATRRWWSGNHPASGYEDFPGVDKWEAMASFIDVSQSIHWRWLKMAKDSKQCVVAVDIFLDRMAGRLMCIWWRDRHQPLDASR